MFFLAFFARVLFKILEKKDVIHGPVILNLHSFIYKPLHQPLSLYVCMQALLTRQGIEFTKFRSVWYLISPQRVGKDSRRTDYRHPCY